MMNDNNIKKKLDSLYIVMPAYNEEEAIEQVVLSWYECLKGKAPESRLVVADSGSQDRTHGILVELQKSHPQLEILGDTLTTHGPKLIALYRYAQLKGADYIFQTDSDGQTEVSEFDAFWKKRRKYEALIGYRKKRGDGIVRKFVEKVVCFLLQIIFGVKVPDANAPYRLMKTSLVAKYCDRFREDYNLPNIMLTTFFAYYRENVAFRIISFKARKTGTNSIHFLKIIKIGIKALADFGAFRKQMREN